MPSYLTTVSAAVATLRDVLTAISPLPSGPLLDAHAHVEEILLCVARHEEDEARNRAAETIRASQARLTALRRNCLRAEMASPRPQGFAPGFVAKGLPDQSSLAQPNTRAEIERAFGIQPMPAVDGVTTVVPLHTGGAHA